MLEPQNLEGLVKYTSSSQKVGLTSNESSVRTTLFLMAVMTKIRIRPCARLGTKGSGIAQQTLVALRFGVKRVSKAFEALVHTDVRASRDQLDRAFSRMMSNCGCLHGSEISFRT